VEVEYAEVEVWLVLTDVGDVVEAVAYVLLLDDISPDFLTPVWTQSAHMAARSGGASDVDAVLTVPV